MHFSSFYSSRRQHLAHRPRQGICLRRCISAIRRPFSRHHTCPLKLHRKGSVEAGIMGEAAEEVEGAGMGAAVGEGDSA
jgi:hypothetical protein